uniref:Uncharacterized protein n=1 Tax=Arundo donax TaxID=35708 RepID=A0A0A8Z2P0_ARUDO
MLQAMCTSMTILTTPLMLRGPEAVEHWEGQED